MLLTQELAHGDGGFGDNLGVLPLLARQVHNILVFVNTSTHDFEANDDVKALFFPVGPPDGSGDKTHNEAFEPGGLRPADEGPAEAEAWRASLSSSATRIATCGRTRISTCAPTAV